MRDVDLFVGVASVGTDPDWADGGPDRRFGAYWRDFAFGAIGESGKARKLALEVLLPRLAIGEQCTIEDRFLVVRGKLSAYKIHLGSGNILMLPDDRYLCIVPARGKDPRFLSEDRLVLPFEGDSILSVILSKAFLLAADDAITDPSILGQIKRA